MGVKFAHFCAIVILSIIQILLSRNSDKKTHIRNTLVSVQCALNIYIYKSQAIKYEAFYVFNDYELYFFM